MPTETQSKVRPLDSLSQAPDPEGQFKTMEVKSTTYGSEEEALAAAQQAGNQASDDERDLPFSQRTLTDDPDDRADEDEDAEIETEEEGDDEEEGDKEETDEEEEEEEDEPASNALKPFNPADPDTYADADPAQVRAALARINQHEERVSKRSSLLSALETLTGGDLDTLEATLSRVKDDPDALAELTGQKDAPVETDWQQVADELFSQDEQLQRITTRRGQVEARLTELQEAGYTESDAEYINEEDKLFNFDTLAEQRREIVWNRYQQHLMNERAEASKAELERRDTLSSVNTTLDRLGADPRYQAFLSDPGNRKAAFDRAAKGESPESVVRDLAFDWMLTTKEDRAREARRKGEQDGRRKRAKGERASLLRGRSGSPSAMRDEQPPPEVAEDMYALLDWKRKRGQFKLIE